MHLELFVRQRPEQERRCRPVSVAHHLTAIRGSYRFGVSDHILDRDRTAVLRTPKISCDPHTAGHLSATELRGVIAAAKRSGRPSDQALIALLALLGLRIQETLAIRIEAYCDWKDGHRVLRLVGKGREARADSIDGRDPPHAGRRGR